MVVQFEQHVVWLDVSVYDPLLMQVLTAHCNLIQKPEGEIES